MSASRNILARSRNICTTSANLTAWYHLTRRKSFYDDLISPAKIKRTYVFM
jgi:hypothetical protein